MNRYIVEGYKPEKLFRYFEDISAIPHGSKNEAGIADFIGALAVSRGLEYYRDELHNVLVKIPATSGYEDEPAVLFQGHTDMVCEKNAGTVHDFLTDPLKLYVKDGYLRARGTTLGADNGIAVAVMLALMDGGAAEHPALECLFTVQEEIGLVGAIAFDYSRVSARTMINMDIEGEGNAVVGCSGGCRTTITLPYEPAAAAGEAMALRITGLMGGHSGIDINLGRANANKLMGRLLLALRRNVDYNLISINGGLMDNAIPRECEAVITALDCGVIKERSIKIAAELAAELGAEDASFAFLCERRELPEQMMKCSYTRRIVSMLGLFGDGVLKMSTDIPDLVEHSRNLGVVRTCSDSVKFTFSTRTAVESQMASSLDYLDAAAEVGGGFAEHFNKYPGWKYERVSPIREKYIEVCRRVLGSEPAVFAVHAGLESGLIKSAIPDLDVISLGPDMANIHTPQEKLGLESCERFWRIIVELLKK